MRILVTLFVSAVVLTIHVLDRPEWFLSSAKSTQAALSDLVQQKDIRVDGLKRLPRSVVEKLLPTDQSVVWWLANTPEIQSRLAKNPWIAKASVEGCAAGDASASRWGCFVILVTERVPRFVATVDSQRWLIADDGTFLSPLDSDDWQGVRRWPVPNAIFVNGLASRVSSPDVMKVQLSVAARAAETLERSVGRLITELRFSGKIDMEVFFKDLSFPVVFNASGDGVSLEEQGKRCQALLQKLGERVAQVAKIDLAFSRVGVVSFKPVETAKPTPKNPT